MSFNLAQGLRASQGCLDKANYSLNDSDSSDQNCNLIPQLLQKHVMSKKKKPSMPFSRMSYYGENENQLREHSENESDPAAQKARKVSKMLEKTKEVDEENIETNNANNLTQTPLLDSINQPDANAVNQLHHHELMVNKKKKSSLFKFTKPAKFSSFVEEPLFDEDDLIGGGSDHVIDDYVPVKRRHGPGRASWKNKIQLFLAFIGYSMGLPNVWRFPYLCYDNGGGAFFIPYIIMLLICGFPLIYLELAIGQLAQAGPIIAIYKFSPLFKGLGIASVIIAFVVSLYNIVIVTWSLFYVFKSFGSTLPWSTCRNKWNTRGCYSVDSTVPDYKYLRMNMSIPSTQEFFENRVLVVSNEGEKSRHIQWELAILLFLAWIIVFFGIRRGVKSIGKAFYLTATLPFIVVIILLVKSVMLPGAYNGIAYLVKPAFEKLLVPEIWILGATQSFYSLGVAFGSLIALASYNDENNNIFRDSIVMSFSSSIISIIVMVTTYSVIGNIAFINNHDIEEAITQGPGLVFVVYPQVFSTLPYTQIWAFLYFLMMICLGLDRQFAMVEVVVTSFYDVKFFDKYLPGRQALVLIICVVSYLLGLVFLAKQGIYYLHLFDYFVVGISFLHVAFFEVLMIVMFFGVNKLSNLLEAFTNRKPSLYIQLCWYTSPILIVVIMFFHVAKHTPIRYDDRYNYPPWATGLGWFLASMPIICVFAGFIVRIYPTKNMTIAQKFRDAFHSIMNSEAEALAQNSNGTPKYRGPLLWKPCLGLDQKHDENTYDKTALTTNTTSAAPLNPEEWRRYYFQKFHDPNKDRHYLYHTPHYHYHHHNGRRKKSEITPHNEEPCDPDEFVLRFMPEVRKLLAIAEAEKAQKKLSLVPETNKETQGGSEVRSETSPYYTNKSTNKHQNIFSNSRNFITKDTCSKSNFYKLANFYSVSNAMLELGLDRIGKNEVKPRSQIKPIYQNILTTDNVHNIELANSTLCHKGNVTD